jgi:hypothetical protein
VFNWRNAIALTVLFLAIAVVYAALWQFINPTPSAIDWTGAVLLGALGVAMGFGFIVLLKSSREL